MRYIGKMVVLDSSRLGQCEARQTDRDTDVKTIRVGHCDGLHLEDRRDRTALPDLINCLTADDVNANDTAPCIRKF